MKNLFILIIFSILISSKIPNVFAAEISAGSSAALLKSQDKKATDSRVKILREFLGKYDSPLAPFAENFVEIADKYELDWRIVAAISGVESTFGKQIPSESFNGWGWGIYGNNTIRFSSWKEGIETVSQGLKIKYIDQWRAQDIYQIGRFYAASPTWASRVAYFMDKIQEFALTNPKDSLSLSL